MFKKFARWILADEIASMDRDLLDAVKARFKAQADFADEAITVDIAKAQVANMEAMLEDMNADLLRADGVISAVFHATEGIKQGTVQKVYRIVSDYYKGE